MPASIDLLSTDGSTIRLPNDRNGTFDVRELAPGLYAVRAEGLSGRFVKQ
jgi:hypothetical protein